MTAIGALVRENPGLLTSMRIRGALLQLMTLAVVVTAHPAFADVWQPLEQWRIAEGRLAPWAQAGTRIDPVYQGREVRFHPTRIVAPQPIACEGATYEWRFVEAEGLFEGNLPAPATAAAQRLGLGPAPIATLRAACANASFDFHRTSRGELLLGLDNVVWTLRPARAASTPTEVLQELLITHFTHDMAFTRESVARKNAFLSADLSARIGRYLAAPQSPDQAPDINGDPFTDSQEYPDRFTLGQARAAAQRTTVPVNFADAHSKRRVDYVLVSEAGRWVVDDLVDERGQSIRRLLGTAQTRAQAVASRESCPPSSPPPSSDASPPPRRFPRMIARSCFVSPTRSISVARRRAPPVMRGKAAFSCSSLRRTEKMRVDSTGLTSTVTALSEPRRYAEKFVMSREIAQMNDVIRLTQ